MASNSRGFGPQPSERRFSNSNANLYGNHVPYAQGYGVNLPAIEPGQGKHKNTWNARLVDQAGDTIKLWITDFETSFEMGGSYAQSRLKRDFYPRNFVQPTVTIKGQMPNSYQYNRLAAFVRNSHFRALTAEDTANDERHSLGRVTGRHFSDGTAVPTVSLQVLAGGYHTRQNTKGPHRAQSLEGYIKKISAGATRFEFAPTFEFEFVVAWSRLKGGDPGVGLYRDSYAEGSQILPWMDIFEKNHFRSGKYKKLDDEIPDFLSGIVNEIGDVINTIFGIL